MSIYDFLYYIILPVLSISVVMVFIRFIIGPRISDRVLALDLLITIGIGIVAVVSILSGQDTFLDIALIFGIIAFLGTVAFSFYLDKKGKEEQ
jgi:multicomponent Na+:H+ antiporter subunit F